jgi:hypothetical protein
MLNVQTPVPSKKKKRAGGLSGTLYLLWKIIWQLLKNIKIDDSVIPYLGIYPRKMKTYVPTKTSMLMIIVAALLFFWGAILEFELRTSHLLGRCSNT